MTILGKSDDKKPSTYYKSEIDNVEEIHILNALFEDGEKERSYKEEESMKKLLAIAILALFVVSCGQAAMQSQLYKHDTLYKNWDHMMFSWFGHRHPTAEDRANAIKQGWWGIEVPYVPGQ
jgi:hypothetical protein